MAYCLVQEREFLFVYSETELESGLADRFWSLFDRFCAGEPVAYITGRKEFYGLDFYVDDRVLIPRPETELLVAKVLEAARQMEEQVKILDVGTGSGCIAIALAKNLLRAKIVGVDIAAGALEVANKNANAHGVTDRVTFMTSDLLSDVGGPFEIVVANLPYIGKKKYNFLSKAPFDYEPHVAFFGGENGLFLYERLFEQLGSQTWQPLLLLGEFGFLQGGEMRALLRKYFGDKWSIFRDLAAIERIFVVSFQR